MSLIINGVEIILPKKREPSVTYEIDTNPKLDEIFSFLAGQPGQEELFLSTNGIDPSWATPI